MKITIRNRQKDIKLVLDKIRRMVFLLCKYLSINTDEIIIWLVTPKAISKLHQAYFQDPTVTDCISFPIDSLPKKSPYHILGECFICPKTAYLYAKEKGKDAYKELSLYLIHCILHLIGYKDEDAKDRVKMRRKERACFRFLKVENALL